MARAICFAALARVFALGMVAGLAAPAPGWSHSGGGSGGGGSGGGGSTGGGGHAAPSGSGSAGSGGFGGSGSGITAPSPRCTATDVGAGRCVRPQAELRHDDELYVAGRALALSGHYAQAVTVLANVQRGDDPMVYTMRGYALRKLGHFEAAMVVYAKALAIDPGNVDTHEYIGEAYVTRGRMDLARMELDKVRQGCGGENCEQYEDLRDAIEAGRPAAP